MNLREQFKKETKEELYYTFQEYSGASIEEHGFSEEYVEWLEKKLVNKTNNIHGVMLSDEQKEKYYDLGFKDGADSAATDT